jgi:hypothetical protein
LQRSVSTDTGFKFVYLRMHLEIILENNEGQDKNIAAYRRVCFCSRKDSGRPALMIHSIQLKRFDAFLLTHEIRDPVSAEPASPSPARRSDAGGERGTLALENPFPGVCLRYFPQALYTW